MAKRIESKLRQAFHPDRLEVLDESHRHAGHGSADATFDGQGGTHMRVRIVAAAFADMGRVARHRAVNEALREELEAGVHALALEIAAPGEKVRW